tara:strand:+ start:30 stop:473 length:444 start_codon:yes stop_codon:yes gene_type:complete
MAIEKDAGPGGVLEQQMLEQAEVLVGDALGENPGVFNFDDGSAIVGEYTEMEATVEVAFDSNLAEVMEEGDLGQISNDLIGSIDDDFSSRQDWEDTYKRGQITWECRTKKELSLLRVPLALFIHFWLKVLHNFKHRRTVRCCLLLVL